MMYPRLRLLHKLLANDGAIFISIGDDELANLKHICNEIFGNKNFVAMFVWASRAKPSNTGSAKYKPQNDAEYILCYKKSLMPNFIPVSSFKTRSYPHTDKDGNYRLQTILKSNRGESKRKTMIFSLNGYTPPETKRWQAGKEKIYELYEKNRITFQTGEPMLKYYKHEENDEIIPFYCYVSKENSNTAENGKILLNDILGNKHGFDTVKPIEIINYIFLHITDKDTIILDSFAGSGTTAHAVLNTNKQDGGNRKFILIEMMDYAESITAERVKRVIDGYNSNKKEIIYDKVITAKNLDSGAAILQEAKAVAESAKGKYTKVNNPKMIDGRLQVIAEQKGFEVVEGTGGNFTFYELGEMLLLPNGNLNENVGIEKIREYVYYMETKEAISADINVNDRYFMGICRDTAYYFYYERDTATTLSVEFLPQIKHKADGYIIYADMCAVSDEELKEWNITFKKIPRDIAKL